MLVPKAGKPIIQQNCGGARILALTAVATSGDGGCETLVEELYGDLRPKRSHELVGEGAGLARLVGVGAGERKRQPDHDAVHATQLNELAKLFDPSLCCRPKNRFDRAGKRSRRVTQRAAAAGRTVVKC